jgi:hypothetical protein
MLLAIALGGVRSLIPEFDARGRLPVGPLWLEDDELGSIYEGHQTNLAEIHSRLCEQMPESVTRLSLYNELRHLCTMSRDLLGPHALLISGEFVVQQADPRSLLVALDMPASSYSEMAGQNKWLMRRVFDDQCWTTVDGSVTINTLMAVTHLHSDHPDHTVSLEACVAARDTASRPNGEDVDGYVELPVGWS